MTITDLDLRTVGQNKHRAALIAACEDLKKGQDISIVTDYDPHDLTLYLDQHFAGAVGWETLGRGPEKWIIQVRKVATTALPHIVCHTHSGQAATSPDTPGALWSLDALGRQLAARIIWIPPREVIPPHFGPAIDATVVVIEGTGQLHTERTHFDLSPGAIVWLPKGSQRSMTAGDHGLRYFSVNATAPLP